MKVTDIDVALGEVKPEKYFRLRNAQTVKSLQNLSFMLSDMDSGSFSYHVNDSKNDFSSWIGDVFNDHTLAESIRHIKDKTVVKQIIDSRLEKLKNIKSHSQSISAQFIVKANRSYVSSGLKDYGFGIVVGSIAGVLIGIVI